MQKSVEDMDMDSISMKGLLKLKKNSNMISLSKSKEYAKLANQVPTIYNIENGQKVLNNNDLKRAGINVLNT